MTFNTAPSFSVVSPSTQWSWKPRSTDITVLALEPYDHCTVFVPDNLHYYALALAYWLIPGTRIQLWCPRGDSSAAKCLAAHARACSGAVAIWISPGEALVWRSSLEIFIILPREDLAAINGMSCSLRYLYSHLGLKRFSLSLCLSPHLKVFRRILIQAILKQVSFQCPISLMSLAAQRLQPMFGPGHQIKLRDTQIDLTSQVLETNSNISLDLDASCQANRDFWCNIHTKEQNPESCWGIFRLLSCFEV